MFRTKQRNMQHAALQKVQKENINFIDINDNKIVQINATIPPRLTYKY